MKWFSLLLVAPLFSLSAKAFIPPVPSLVREVFEGRKPKKSLELLFRHTIRNEEANAPVVIEERMVLINGKAYFWWKTIGSGQVVTGTRERHGYKIQGEKNLPSRSALFLKYFLGHSGEDFLRLLLAEQFVRRDQFSQFKPDFLATGDPNSWNSSENAVRHNDIFLLRLRRGIGITVVGLEEGSNRKAVSFDQALKGFRRFEWKEAEQTHVWEFDEFVNYGKEGVYPRRLFYETNNDEKIRSELLSLKSLSDRQASDSEALMRRSEKAGAPPVSMETALQLLLSFR